MAETIKAMGVKNVVGFAETTDYGIGEAKEVAKYLKELAPDVHFLQTGLVISMVVIGRMGTVARPIIGALLVYVASEMLRDVGNVQMSVFATLVILFARFFRDGLWGIGRRLAQRYG